MPIKVQILPVDIEYTAHHITCLLMSTHSGRVCASIPPDVNAIRVDKRLSKQTTCEYYYYYYYYMIYLAPISRIKSEVLASLGGEHD